jgi:DNA repair exonuclease SbcCD ATPase subunit
MTTFRTKIDALLADLRHAERQAGEEQAALEAARERQENVLAAQVVIQETAEAVQQVAHQQISSVVSRCLEAVWGEDAYEFKIAFRQARGKTEAELLFCRDGMELTDPTEESGGGPVDVAVFALRLVCLLLTRPRRRKMLVLDEPFRFVSADLIPAVREMLTTLAKEFKVQFVIVTHQQRLRCGKVVQIGEE